MSVCWLVCVHPFVCVSVCPVLSMCMSVWWSVCTYQLVCLSVCLTSAAFLMHVYVCVLVTLYLSLGLFVCLSHLWVPSHARVCLYAGYSVHINWSVCLSVCLSVCHTSAAFFTHVYVCAVASLYTPIRHNSEGTRNYTEMGDERLLETDYDRAVYDVTSPYQRVCIMQSRQFGHVLTLDDDVSKSPVPVFWGRFLWRVSVSSVSE